MKSESGSSSVLARVSCSIFLAFLMLSMCLSASDTTPVEYLAELPQASSNNAVALVPDGNSYRLVSALGLGSGKSWNDSSSQSWQMVAANSSWSKLAQVPGHAGRLAASAVTVGGKVYLFGGYTVAADGAEQSTPEVYLLDESAAGWTEFTLMPVAVEDAVVLSYQDRFVYLVSGWHDLGNVNLVQILDTQTGQWQQATPYPGAPVFGHAGSLAAGAMLICDGVRIAYSDVGAARRFELSSECWLGAIDRDDHRRIQWQPVSSHPGQPRYRMAAGSNDSDEVWFVGGSETAYNYDGMGYDGKPSEPAADLLSFNVRERRWQCHGRLHVATMDHRGLPWHAGWFYVIGGMRAGQLVSAEVFRFWPPPANPC